jgi:hypothetical protein
MAMVKFATTCDISLPMQNRLCGVRSEEYSQWPRCRYCDEHACPTHARPNSTVDADLDSPATCVCTDCCPEERDQLTPGESWDEWTDTRDRVVRLSGRTL